MNKIYPYAGFWKRAAAFIIDCIIIGVPFVVLLIGLAIFFTATDPQNASRTNNILGSIFQLCGTLWYLFYFAYLESGPHQATFGKRALKIKVMDEHGQRLSFMCALVRALGKLVSGSVLDIGFLLAGATRKKQALHDMMVSTYVVDKKFQPGDELPDVPTRWGVFWSAVGTMILSIILFIGLWIGLAIYLINNADKTPKPRPQQTSSVLSSTATPQSGRGN